MYGTRWKGSLGDYESEGRVFESPWAHSAFAGIPPLGRLLPSGSLQPMTTDDDASERVITHLVGDNLATIRRLMTDESTVRDTQRRLDEVQAALLAPKRDARRRKRATDAFESALNDLVDVLVADKITERRHEQSQLPLDTATSAAGDFAGFVRTSVFSAAASPERR